METNNLEKKNQRISKAQKQKLVDYMSSHLEFARGQFSKLNSNVSGKNEWETLSQALNSQGGSFKTVEQWKKCWADLKGAVRNQINKRRSFMNKTGGGSFSDAPRDLNSFEEQILAIITTDAVDGDSRTTESGVMHEEYLNESLNSIECLDDADIHQIKKTPPPKSSISTSSMYKDAVQEARETQAFLKSEMLQIKRQNQQILQKLSEMDTKLNSMINF